MAPTADPTVRRARPGERVAVSRILDAALLDLGDLDLEAAIRDGRAVVALVDGTVLGALVFAPHERGSGAHVEAVAVRRARRDEGIGTALVGWLRERGRVTADCRPAVRPFYEALGFRLVERDGRLCGVIEARSR